MKIDVKHIAKLANLEITPEKEIKLEKQLTSILDYIDKLQEVDTNNIPETNQVTGLENITREDVSSPSLTQQESLSNSKSTHNGMFKVKGVLQGE